MKEYTTDIRNPELVAAVDKAGVSTATLNDVKAVLRKLIRNN